MVRLGIFRSSSRNLRRRNHSRNVAVIVAAVENLETRCLFSFGGFGFNIPSVPSIPSIPTITIPSFVKDYLNGIPVISKPTVANSWWLKNTGQTLAIHPAGPATGTPGADVNAVAAWNITQGSKNVVIAVLDTGFDLSNPDLASVLWTKPAGLTGDPMTGDTHGWNFLTNSSNVNDNFVHGTAVASAIHSVAPGVTILPVVIGTAAGANDQDVINGINYIIALKKAGVNIVAINASYISTSPTLVSQLPAIKAAGDAGMLYCAASGNLGMNLDSLIPSGLGSFASSFLPSNLMFVAATDNQDHLASFSDYGANTVAVGAPGVDMSLAIPGGIYAPLSGTSFAAPMVSAIAGLIASKYPTATMTQIKTAIINSGDLDPALAGKTISGRRVDAYNALQYMAGQITPPAPTPPPAPVVPPTNNFISIISGFISKYFHF